MKKIILFILLFAYNSAFLSGQRISGNVFDENSGEHLSFVQIYTDLGDYSSSNNYGFYSILSDDRNVTITFSLLGYIKKSYTVELLKDTVINVGLTHDNLIDQIVINSDREEIDNNQAVGISAHYIPVKNLEVLPTLMGEQDIFKGLQLLPGIQKGHEGNSGLYVRGGTPEQNLILLDGVPIYNPVHLFGFTSAINPNAIKSVNLIKGGIPARFGERLSSVLDMNMKEGNAREFSGVASIGLLSSKFVFEGPIKKDRSSFLITFRRTYLDFLFNKIIGKPGDLGYFFYDGSAKINYRFNDKDRIFFSLYGGKDKLYGNQIERNDDQENRTNVNLGWKNLTYNLRWNRIWSNSIFTNFTLYKTDYSLHNLQENINIENESVKTMYGFNYDSDLYDIGLKFDFQWYLKNHTIRLGANLINHHINPGAFHIKQKNEFNSFDSLISQNRHNPLNFNVYAEDEIVIKDIKMNIGLRASHYLGYDNIVPILQPRISARYGYRALGLKISYMRTAQYLHKLVNEEIGIPADIWLPSNEKVKPMSAHQFSVGGDYRFSENFDFKIDAYYKNMKNTISYKEGEGIYGFKKWEDRVTQGTSTGIGVELFCKYKLKGFLGWVGYSLSKVEGRFEDIQDNKPFPLFHDRTHDLSVVASYSFSESIKLSSSWVYSSGQPFTIPNSEYYIDISQQTGDLFGDYYSQNLSERNNFRLRPYHRLDISFDFIKEKSNYTRTISVGAYNLYSRSNPVYGRLGYNDNNKPVILEESLFPILPFVRYTISF